MFGWGAGNLWRREGLARRFRHALTLSTRACLRSSLTSAGCADSRSARLTNPPVVESPPRMFLVSLSYLAFFSIALPDSMLGSRGLLCAFRFSSRSVPRA